MPITKSAKKALRQNFRRRARNLAKKKALAEAIKKYRKLAEGGSASEAKTALSAVYQLLDKAAKTKLIKKAAASRTKSRLAKLLKR